jgi:vitamin B12 transporter
MTRLTLLSGAAALLIPAFVQTGALAQTAAPPPPDAPEVVVVADRAPEPIIEIGQSVSVIDAAQIEASQALNVSDLLAATPGISVVHNGGLGGVSSVFIRGAESEQTVVLIDGVKLNDPGAPSGGFDFANLLTGDVSRIEILRGGASTLYGSDAIGGVVNVVTTPPAGPLQGDASAEGGSRDTQYYRAGIGGTEGPLSFRLAGGYFSTNGVSQFDKAFGGVEPDGFLSKAVSGRVTYAITPDIVLDERAFYTDSKTAIDGYNTPTYSFGDDDEYETTRQFVDYTGVNVSLFGGALKNRIAFQYTDIDRADFEPMYAPDTLEFYSRGKSYRAEYQGTWTIVPGWRAVFGAEHERDTINTEDVLYDPAPLKAAVDLDGFYLQLHGEPIKNLAVTAGVREDHHSTFGDHTTGQADAAYSLNGGATVLRASVSQGFKAPTLYQLYSDYGNRALTPETSTGWDAGVEQRLWDGKASLEATYFSRQTHNQIGFFDCYPTTAPLCATEPYGYYANIVRTEAQGVEVQGTARPIPALSLSANYTYVDADDRSPGSTTFGNALARRPKDLANAEADYLWPIKLTTTVAVRYSGSSFDNAANTIRLKSYTLVDLRASYPLPHGLELYGRIENLFDQHYETAYQYGTLGRGGFVGVRATF